MFATVIFSASMLLHSSISEMFSSKFHDWTSGPWYSAAHIQVRNFMWIPRFVCFFLQLVMGKEQVCFQILLSKHWSHQVWEGAVKEFGIPAHCLSNVRTPALLQFALAALDKMFDVSTNDVLVGHLQHSLGKRHSLNICKTFNFFLRSITDWV